MKRLFRLLPDALVPNSELGLAQRWRLLDSLYLQKRSLIEGSVAQLAVLLVCDIWSDLSIFRVIAALTAILLVARLYQAACFQRARDRYTPRIWARWFAVGAGCSGLLWGTTSLLALLTIHNPPIHTVVLIVQAGWLAGASIRNVASPAAMAAQTTAVLLLSMIGSLANGTPVYQVTALFYLVMFSSVRGIAQYLQRQMVAMLLSEQRLAEVAEQMTCTCAELEIANARLEQLSATDGLTDLANRRAFDSRLQTEWKRAARDGSVLSLLIMDVDLFKLFNDNYGHPAGDECLRVVAASIALGVPRVSDFTARYGGEEFVALLPGTDAAGAWEVAERLHSNVAIAALAHAQSPFGVVTISIGAASARPEAGGDPLALVKAADQGLYRAKQAGRNRTDVAAPVTEDERPQASPTTVGGLGETHIR